jgi:hypothetical protein
VAVVDVHGVVLEEDILLVWVEMVGVVPEERDQTVYLVPQTLVAEEVVAIHLSLEAQVVQV